MPNVVKDVVRLASSLDAFARPAEKTSGIVDFKWILHTAVAGQTAEFQGRGGILASNTSGIA
jgi:hypothetical protein